jgi:hypothetical protein
MKKYKLIRKYPTCLARVGDIVSPYTDSRFYKNDRHSLFYKDDVENYPEHWEKIIEKDYEILSFKTQLNCIITFEGEICIKRSDNGTPSHTVSKSAVLEKGSSSIHSVKRLSDGKVFTVGDEVNSTISDLGIPTELIDFRLKNEKLTCGLRHLGYYPFKTLLKKKLLFRTEDGVDIFEGDKVFIVTKTYFHFSRNPCLCNSNFKPNSNYLYFSTKEAAEEYILMNKPCLSINDVSVLKNIISSSWDITLKELIKSKQS